MNALGMKKTADSNGATLEEFLNTCSQTDRYSCEMKFGDFVSDIYLPFSRSRKRSWKTEESLLRNHLLPRLEDRLLEQIGAIDLIKLQSSLINRGYKPGSINRVTLLVKVIINTARKWKMTNQLTDWAADAPELPDHEAREKYLTSMQAEALIRICLTHENQTASNLILALLFTGARKSELLFSTWSNLDVISKTLKIPLSKSGRPRYIYLSSEALEVLLKQREIAGFPFIFSKSGQIKPISNISKVWVDVRRRAQLDDFRIHDLRHSFASFAILNGVSIYEVQKLLGHADTKTTMKYAHLSNHQLLKATTILPGALTMLDKTEG